MLAVGANYLLTIAAESRVAAVQAEVTTAQALYQLALDQENAGLSPQIDTLRSRVQLQAQQQTLIQAQNDLEKQRIALGPRDRFAGAAEVSPDEPRALPSGS